MINKGMYVMKKSIYLAVILAAAASCALPGSAAMAAGPAADYYYDGGQRHTLLLDDTLLAAFGAAPSAVKSVLPDAQTAQTRGGAAIYRIQPGSYKSVAGVIPGAAVSPVFHDGGSATGRLMALPGGVLVNFKPDWTAQQVSDWAAAKGLAVDKKLSIGQNWYLIKSAPGQASLDLANQIHQSGDVISATPNWWKDTSTR